MLSFEEDPSSNETDEEAVGKLSAFAFLMFFDANEREFPRILTNGIHG